MLSQTEVTSGTMFFFSHFATRAPRKTGGEVVELCSKNGGEHISNKMGMYCKNTGIRHNMGSAHTPQMNSIAER